MMHRKIAYSFLLVCTIGVQAFGQNPSDSQRIADLEKAVQALSGQMAGVKTTVDEFTATTEAARLAHANALAKDLEAHKAATTDAVGNLASALQERVPIGTVIAYAGLHPELLEPLGWAVCDGRAMPLTEENRALFNVLGTSHGGTGADPAKPDSFCLPDFRSRFLRGVNTKDTDAERLGDEKREAPRPDLALKGNWGFNVGSLQRDSLQEHTHVDNGHKHEAEVVPRAHDHGYRTSISDPGGSPPSGRGGLGETRTSPASLSVTVDGARSNMAGTAEFPPGSEAVRAGRETRPLNVYIYYIIRIR